MIKVTIQQEKQYASLGDWYRDDVVIEFDNLYKLQSLLDVLGISAAAVGGIIVIDLPKVPAWNGREGAEEGEGDAKEAES